MKALLLHVSYHLSERITPVFVATGVILCAILAGSLLQNRFSKWRLTMPLAMVLIGIILGWESSAPILAHLDNSGVERTVEVVLAILLFLDATEVRGGWRAYVIPLIRLVIIGVPLSLLLALLSAATLFPHQRLAFCLVLACIAVPTDMAPASRLLSDERIPQRLRDVLNTESGYNDGIVAPIFLVAIEMMRPDGAEGAVEAFDHLLPSAVQAILIGLGIGAFAAVCISHSVKREWAQGAGIRVAVLTVPLIAYVTASGINANGFVAAFLAGVAFRAVRGPAIHHELELAEDFSLFSTMALWFVLGQLAEHVFTSEFHWRVMLFAVLCLTVVRIVPVILSLTPSSMPWTQRLVIGWAGPRGIASIVFALLALPILHGTQRDLMLEVLVTTVLMSLVLHGLSAPAVAAFFDKNAATKDASGATRVESV